MRPDLNSAAVLGAALGVALGFLGGSTVAMIEGDRAFAIDTVIQATGPGELPAKLITEEVQRGSYVSSRRVGVVVDRPGRPQVRLLGLEMFDEPGTLTVLDDDTVRWSTPGCHEIDLTVP